MRTVQRAEQSHQRREPRAAQQRKDYAVKHEPTDPRELIHTELCKHALATFYAERTWCHRWGEPSCLVDLYWHVGDDQLPIELETVRIRVHDSDEYLRILAIRVANTWHERIAKRATIVIANEPHQRPIEPERLARVLKRSLPGEPPS